MRLYQVVVATSVAAAAFSPACKAADVPPVGVGAAAARAQTANLGPIGEGRRAWLKFNCYGCHGNNAAGGMGPNVRQYQYGDVLAAMRGDVSEGGMRSFAKYTTATDAQNITAYLNSIGGRNEPTWLDWWNPIP
jgi:cytochrome c551